MTDPFYGVSIPPLKLDFNNLFRPEGLKKIEDENRAINEKIAKIKGRASLPGEAIVVTVNHTGRVIDISVKAQAYKAIQPDQLGQIIIALINQAALTVKAKTEKLRANEVDPDIAELVPELAKSLSPKKFQKVQAAHQAKAEEQAREKEESYDQSTSWKEKSW